VDEHASLVETGRQYRPSAPQSLAVHPFLTHTVRRCHNIEHAKKHERIRAHVADRARLKRS